MSTGNEALTLATSDKWVIRVGKEAYQGDEAMVDLIKQADKSGHRGMIHFKNFSVSIPHIQSMQKITKPGRKWNEIDPQDYQLAPLTPEEIEANKQRIVEIKKKLASK